MEERRYYYPRTSEDGGAAPSLESEKDTQRKRDYCITKKENELFNARLVEMYGNFYFLFYSLNSSGIDKQHIIRFLYLCTFLDYENMLVYGNQLEDAKYMSIDDFPRVLKLGRAVAKRTEEAFFKYKLISLDEFGHLMVNKKYCTKGKIATEYKKSMKIRLFERAVRELYEKSKPTEHRKLNLLITLLPHINFYHNILCYNPDCQFKYQIRPMDIKQVAKIVNYSESNISRLKKDLLSLRVGGEEVVMICITDTSQMIKINPRLYYRASKDDAFDLLADDFLIIK